jgi:hypothetical protein
VTVSLGLLLAFSSTACNGAPTGPPAEDRPALYTGKWRGNINGMEVVLDIQSGRGELIGITGSGTARNSATGEIRPLRVSGFGSFNDAHGTADVGLWVDPVTLVTGDLTGGRHTGDFRGNVSGDGRTWPGRWTPTNLSEGEPIFGTAERSLTLIKD